MSYIAALPKELRNLLDHYVNYTYWKIVSDVYEFCFAMTDEQTDLDWFYDAELKPLDSHINMSPMMFLRAKLQN